MSASLSFEDLGVLTATGFDGSRFTSAIRAQLWAGSFDGANHLVESAVEAGHLAPDHYRILNAQAVIRDVQTYVTYVRELADNPQFDSEVIELDVSDRPTIGGVPQRLTPSTPQGRYVNYTSNYPVTRASITDLDLPKHAMSRFVAAGFALHRTPSLESEELWVERDCRVTSGHPGSLALVSGDNTYVPSRSGRLAKASRMNVVSRATTRLPEALVLPFAHAPTNYYHSLSEMVYGLRHSQRVSSECPIIFGDDHFGILPSVVEALGISPQRLVPAESARSFLIETAYVPGINPFSWSSSFTRFFRTIAQRTPRGAGSPLKNVYISRRNSSRSPAYEPMLEEWLTERGFTVVYSEQLSIRDQINLFADASCVVAHHGAGLANIAFSRDDLQLIEIFPGSMIAPDFCQRARYVTPLYAPLIGDTETILSDLARLISA